MQIVHDEFEIDPEKLTHRIRNLEQENQVLKAYLCEIPEHLGSILALDCEDSRRKELGTLHGRLNRFGTRIARPEGIYTSTSCPNERG